MDDYAYITSLSADDITRLRKPDVERVLEFSKKILKAKAFEYAAWVIEKRPDLEQEVRECAAELDIEVA